MNLLVIGGGPGGYVAAIAAAKRGVQVTLVEKGHMGGTCLNRGCIPTKAILHSANLLHASKDFAQYGIVIPPPRLDFQALMRRKDAAVNHLRQGVEYLLGKAGVTVVRGEARFLSRGEVAALTAEGEVKLPAQNVIIATGSAPVGLPFAQFDGDRIINSDQALELESLPDRLVIIGGGVIGCEFAQAFARLGSRVTIIEQLDALLSTMDADQSALIQRVLRKDGVQIHLSSSVNGLTVSGAGVAVSFTENGARKSVEADKVLIAVGRKPVTGTLNALAAGIALGAHGAVPVDGMCHTNVEGIYAIGDVTGGIQLAHVASHQGIMAVKNLFGGQEEFDERAIPYCVYTNPELASMGYTERMAREAGRQIKTGMFPVSANGKAYIEGARDGFSKIVSDETDGTILGLHLAGPNVTEMISPFSTIIQFESTVDDISSAIFAHPTVSEIIHESILDIAGQAINKV